MNLQRLSNYPTCAIAHAAIARALRARASLSYANRISFGVNRRR